MLLGMEVYKESLLRHWGCHLGSGNEWLGLLLSHQSSTPAISVPLMEREYIQDELSSLFIHVHAPSLLRNSSVSMTLVV